ncbi:hypothetical protein [Mucilaginibacter paludis]|uniref:Uncharacterized protein n=1 Tax=Mucilaginibacter paludis DSM 18603 TaxID=714943 RepID=H1YBD7_9SPHI|nr:hypothetical protein [Mucilaginibacter paludis]EHQ31191.1 hypothetical protein Mucpa_7148 [Mucilaginibacter paludis DSM 18603]
MSNDPFNSHGWFFNETQNGVFMMDLAGTISGDVDLHAMPTRYLNGGDLFLAKPLPKS